MAACTSSTPAALELAPGDQVVVDTTRGADFGRLVKGPDEVPAADAPQGLKKVLRKATEKDIAAVASHRATELTPSARAARSSTSSGWT